MKYGLSEKQLNEIIAILSTFTEIEEAILFGSRAIDTYKEASDVDIALKGDKVTASLAAKLKYQFEEDTYLPFFFDFVAYTTITNEALKEHIDTKGVSIYRAGWRECKLGDVADVQAGHFGSQLHSSDYIPKGIPSIMPTNIGNRLEINRNNIACIKDSDAKKLERYLVKEGDVVYSRRGDVEKCAFITGNESGWLYGTGCLRIRFKRDKVIPKYCAYFLSTDEIKGWVSGHAVGTTMPNLNSAILSNVPIVLPSLSEQCAIASVLSSLDDKIDLLHRQNKTLEAMAETLFRQWFVEEADERWAEDSLLALIQLVGGGTPKTSIPDYWDGNIPWLAGGDIASNHKSFVLNTEKTITENGLNNSSAKLLPKYATVISARGTVGKYCLLAKSMAFGQSNYGILPRIDNCYFFTYLLINHIVEELQASSYGSVFDTITTTAFKENKVPIPNESEIRPFENSVSSYFHKIFQNKTQISTLEKLRDTLLPKLMSGEVRVYYSKENL